MATVARVTSFADVGVFVSGTIFRAAAGVVGLVYYLHSCTGEAVAAAVVSTAGPHHLVLTA